ncbi:hypothetical protein BZG36_02510 [Bifiguratus adelaidae]|uniref:Enoyl reductase (ER) domain-containing protein n=1 Tax=Bifiguratus adelaidae TaxID=1938954 RepID=A0A261Y2P3_9FUNG|nr:hypothetical protein BZG36_02510 [Bifiguratus adelaidae]
MRAVTFQEPYKVTVEEVSKPVIEHPEDAIVRVILAGLCGSDLHPYRGAEKGLDAGTIMGHEFVGLVEQVGDAVPEHILKVGDRVGSGFTTCCGRCWYCEKGITCRCDEGQLFGWRSQQKGIHGAQAEYVRVPFAASTLLKLPEAVTDIEALLLGDIFSTGYFCVQQGLQTLDLEAFPIETLKVAIVGCGPVGIMTIIAAQALGIASENLYAIDSVKERLELAQKYGAQALSLPAESAANGFPDVVSTLKQKTTNRGVDLVLEVVGHTSALELGYTILRPAGTISSIGVHTHKIFPFSPGDGYDKNLTYRSGRCPSRAMMERLLPIISKRKADGTWPWNLEGIVSHRVSIDEAEMWYPIFERRQQGCTKVVFHILAYREITLETGVISQTSGSARCRVGTGSDVLVGVKVEIGETGATGGPDDEGYVVCNVECSPSASQQFEGRGADEINNEYTQALQRIYSGKQCGINLKKLCIIPRMQCWVIYIDALVLDYDGNVFDAITIATRATLFNTRIPKTTIADMGEGAMEFEVLDDVEEAERIEGWDNVPISVTLNKIGNRYFVDAAPLEELCADVRLMVSVNEKGNICSMQKGGSGSIEPTLLNEMLNSSQTIALAIIKAQNIQLEEEEAQELAKRSTGQHVEKLGFFAASHNNLRRQPRMTQELLLLNLPDEALEIARRCKLRPEILSFVPEVLQADRQHRTTEACGKIAFKRLQDKCVMYPELPDVHYYNGQRAAIPEFSLNTLIKARLEDRMWRI